MPVNANAGRTGRSFVFAFLVAALCCHYLFMPKTFHFHLVLALALALALAKGSHLWWLLRVYVALKPENWVTGACFGLQDRVMRFLSLCDYESDNQTTTTKTTTTTLSNAEEEKPRKSNPNRSPATENIVVCLGTVT